MAAPRSKSWLKLFEAFVEDVRIASKESASTDERGGKLDMWESQRRVIREIGSGLDRDIHSFNILKSAQLGVTTITLCIDVFWFAMHPNLIGCLVTDDEHKRDANRDFITKQIESFPEGYFGERFRIIKNNRTALHFSNGSRLDLLVAGTKKKSLSWAEGIGYGYGHLCMALGTPVIVEDGHVKRIEDVVVGDMVITHTGKLAKVVDSFGQPNNKGPMIRIWPWLGAPIYCTDEHTIPTARGIVEAKDVRKDDLLLMPIRRITKERIYSHVLPKTEEVGRANASGPGWIRVLSYGSGAAVKFDEEFGFAMGYYLAEGHLILNDAKRPCAISFYRHREEGAYSDRAVAALKPYISGSVKTVDVKNSLTTSVTIYSTALAMWIDSIFGRTSTKRIPDEAFEFGADFCRGLLAGLLCGDGSKGVPTAPTVSKVSRPKFSKNGKRIGNPRNGPTDPDKRYEINYVVLPTIRSSIATQSRDIAAALGYGWGSIRYEPAAEKHGRMCQEQWRVCWSGSAAFYLRGLMGLRQIPMAGVKGEKYFAKDGQVHIKIRSIETGFEEPMMWDLSVDHDDHTFRTTSVAVGNTETAKYGDPRGLKSLEERFAQTNPHRLYIYESTADGFNHWRTKWQRGLDDPGECSMFIGWWSGDTNRIERRDPRFKNYGLYPESSEERENIVQVAQLYNHRVTPEQLAWYRWKQSGAGAEQGLLDQNQPWTADQAFVQSGYSFFQSRVIGSDIKYLTDNGPIYDGYRYEVSDQFFDFKMVAMRPSEGDSADDVELKIYEEPVDGAQYVIGCDPAYGRNEHKDHHGIFVGRCFADRIVQVAEFVTCDIETKHLAWVLFHLCAAYRNSMANVEIGGPGRLVMAEFAHLRQLLGAEMNAAKVEARGWQDAAANARWYLYHKIDSPGAGYMNNFETNWRTKDELMHGYRGVYSSREIVIRSLSLLYEMNNVVVVDGSIGAPESSDEDMKDDRVFAAALAVRAWTDWVRKDMITQGLTHEVVMQAEEIEAKSPYDKGVGSIIKRFLQNAEEEANKEPEPDWLQRAGLR